MTSVTNSTDITMPSSLSVEPPYYVVPDRIMKLVSFYTNCDDLALYMTPEEFILFRKLNPNDIHFNCNNIIDEYCRIFRIILDEIQGPTYSSKNGIVETIVALEKRKRTINDIENEVLKKYEMCI